MIIWKEILHSTQEKWLFQIKYIVLNLKVKFGYSYYCPKKVFFFFYKFYVFLDVDYESEIYLWQSHLILSYKNVLASINRP